ncbi:MAG: hypothetical protein IID61_01695 [SAR324 cluster bacterium]|nr:hypothetical protein [SAR324 cluster bacterium]
MVNQPMWAQQPMNRDQAYPVLSLAPDAAVAAQTKFGLTIAGKLIK